MKVMTLKAQVGILWNVATLKVLTVGHSEVRNLFTHTHRQFDIAPQRQVISASRLAYTVGQSASLYSRNSLKGHTLWEHRSYLRINTMCVLFYPLN